MLGESERLAASATALRRVVAAATIEGVLRWFGDPSLARRDGEAAGAWIRQTWRWERMYERFDDILASLGVALGER